MMYRLNPFSFGWTVPLSCFIWRGLCIIQKLIQLCRCSGDPVQLGQHYGQSSQVGRSIVACLPTEQNYAD